MNRLKNSIKITVLLSKIDYIMYENTLIVVVVTCAEVEWDETCCCPGDGPLWDS